ncbi:MAG: livH [Thermomicrobiales bacterium]|nr:livH [Thermomicrobiales bacterium]MDF3038584.1 livH [Thermomicrobiales bacterium]
MIDAQLVLQLLVSGIVLGSRYALIAVSFGIIYSTTQIFHLAHAGTYTIAAYAAIVVGATAGGSLWLAVLAGLLAAVLFGALTELVMYRPMRRRSATKLAMFLASLGLSIVVSSAMQIIFGPQNLSLQRVPNATYFVGNITITALYIAEIVVGWTAIAALLVFLRKTQYGRAVNAVRTNPQVAMAVGISVDRIYLLVMMIGSLLVGVAALLFLMGNVAFPTMGLAPILIGFIAVFLGGTDNVLGAALGGLVLGLATSLSGIWLAGDFASVVVFGILFIVLVFRPQGLLGRAAV